MPEYINVDLSKLDFGRAIKVAEIEANNFEILDTPIASVAVVEVPRALRGKSEEAEEEGEEVADEASAGGEE